MASVGGKYNRSLESSTSSIGELETPLGVRFSILAGKHVGDDVHVGRILALSPKAARVRSEAAVDEMSDLRLKVEDAAGQLLPGHSYAKVVSCEGDVFTLRFTAGAPAVALAQGEATNAGD